MIGILRAGGPHLRVVGRRQRLDVSFAHTCLAEHVAICRLGASADDARYTTAIGATRGGSLFIRWISGNIVAVGVEYIDSLAEGYGYELVAFFGLKLADTVHPGAVSSLLIFGAMDRWKI